MKFSNIPGKSNFKNQLIHQIDGDTLPHAMLLLGPQGSGKLATALSIAAYLMCETRDGKDACSTCPSCLKTQKLVHPDIHFVYPVGKIASKNRSDTVSTDFVNDWREALLASPFLSAEAWQSKMGDGSSTPNINVAECRSIIHNLSMHSYEGRYKIQIVWQAQYLGKEGNRLLKLIEEPTPNTFLILIAEREDQLLNTIVSRCQIVQCKPFSSEEIQVGLGDAMTDDILFLSRGNMIKAMELIDSAKQDFSDDLLDWMRVAWQKHPDTLFPFIDKIIAMDKDELQNFVHYGVQFLREYLKLLFTQDSNLVRLQADEIETAMKMTKIIDSEKAIQIIHIFDETLKLIRRNINVRILFTQQTLAIGTVLKSEDHAEATSRASAQS